MTSAWTGSAANKADKKYSLCKFIAFLSFGGACIVESNQATSLRDSLLKYKRLNPADGEQENFAVAHDGQAQKRTGEPVLFLAAC
jgi:hypothetical protein